MNLLHIICLQRSCHVNVIQALDAKLCIRLESNLEASLESGTIESFQFFEDSQWIVEQLAHSNFRFYIAKELARSGSFFYLLAQRSSLLHCTLPSAPKALVSSVARIHPGSTLLYEFETRVILAGVATE